MVRIVAGAAVVLFSLSAAAQELKKESPLPSHLPLKTEACFGRVYDAAHLAAHPKQRVTSFHIVRQFKDDPNLEVDPTPEQEIKENDGEHGYVIVTAYVRFRDKAGVYSNGLTCRRSEGKVFCGIDCDGGSFNLKPSGQSLLLENNGFVVVGGCGASEDEQENEEYVRPGADDKTFRLDPKPFAACMAERAAMAPAFAKLGKPLRIRFEQNETVCFNRSYDAAHLASHPKQTVKRIAVMKTKGSKPDPNQVHYELTFALETRDGKKFSRKVNCLGDRYAFGCQPDEQADMDTHFYLTRAGDDGMMLRDKRGLLGKAFKTSLGNGDRMFKLKAAPAEACRF
ncbi:MAG TPA: hypothetical protein VJL90_12875 [Pseudorhodoplanes sp.]|nr:hypothetical protein [Pseudorhodoplanes sp.]